VQPIHEPYRSVDWRTDSCWRVFALTVDIAASNSFLLPTHQFNALIMGPGGYRNIDNLRAGAIMTVLFLLVLVPMLVLFYAK
jgi:di/tricarboxylate transporter